jgi:hypothetical protein
MLTKGRARATELFDREAAETWSRRHARHTAER